MAVSTPPPRDGWERREVEANVNTLGAELAS